MKTERPNCSKCKKSMRHVSTGMTCNETVKTYVCGECKENKTVREEKK